MPCHALQAVVFDLDGTLVDSLRDLAEATNASLQAAGYPPRPLEEYPLMVGNGARKLMERALGPSATPERTKHLLEGFLERYDRDCLRYSLPYAGMPEAVAKLKRQGCRLFVVTNKPDAQARKIMKALYGEGLFERVCGQTGRFPVKPDPSLTRSLLEEAGLSPDQAAFVGDSGVDMETAHNAGMRAVGVLWGFRGEAELSDAGADCLAASPEELPTLLLSGGLQH